MQLPAASVAALQGDAHPLIPESHNDALALLDERRMNLSTSRTRTANQLHALLRVLLAGGAPVALSAAKARAALRGFRARTATDSVRVDLCRELIADLTRFDKQLAANKKELDRRLDDVDTRLRTVDGVGPVLAARILGRTGRASRFPTAASFATYNGTAPVQIASAESNRYRLSRYGDRQLNSALHTIAMVQIRMPGSAGRAYFDKKIAEGMAPRAATRCLKRHLSNHLWRIMLADERPRARSTQRENHTAA